MDTITFEDFAKVKLRVAKIMDCEPVEGSDKLYKLSIRVGEETRTLAAGLAKHYAPDELLGKRIVIVANLAPRTLKGVESQGMLLAAEDKEGHLGLLTVDDDEVKDGAEVG